MTPPLAVLGIDVSVPGAPSFHALMEALVAGRTNTRSFPAARLTDASLATSPEDHYEGGYFEAIDAFDHRYFKISARVAASMDPFQRWCLLSSVRAVEDAGLTGALAGVRVGVYASCNGLQQRMYADLQRAHGSAPDLMATLHSGIAARISHHLDLHGPAVMVDTACSSSLYAAALAASELAAGRIDVALVTAANLYLDPGVRGSAAVNVVSERSRTRAFDKAADGASMGEGVVTMVLRRAQDAGGPGRGGSAYGYVHGWAVGQDGRTATMASPNPAAQRDVVDDAWFGLDPHRLGLLVSHGTGTAVGDAVEIEALSGTRTLSAVARSSVALVAPKVNVGHLDAASGLLSLAVALGSVSTGVVPPHAAFVSPADGIDLATSPFYVPTEAEPLPGSALAGISSFGMTGTHAHVVVGGGSRRPGPPAELPLTLDRYWYPVEGNTFAKPATRPHTALGVRSAIFPVETHRDWEIAEHRVGGVPLMVGTSVFEILSRLLDGSPLDLVSHDVVDLTILRPLTATHPRLEILAAVSHDSLAGEVSAREGDGEWIPWVRFKLAPTEWLEPLTDAAPAVDGLADIPVTTLVGDDASVSVSTRWSVVTTLHCEEDRTRGILALAPPRAHAGEFADYHFYPPLVDAALNGMNDLMGGGEILLPWLCDRIRYHASELTGTEFTTHIVQRDLTQDERGNVILTLDVDLWDQRGQCVLSVRGYRVKNRVGERAAVVDFHRVGFDHEPEVRSGAAPTLGVVVLDGVDASTWAGPGRALTTAADVLATTDPLPGVGEVVLVGGGSGADIGDECYDIGRLLLHLHSHSPVRLVTLLEPGAYAEDSPGAARARARAATAYSLRAEFRFDVAVVDGPAEPASIDALAAYDLDGIHVLRDGRLRAGRFRPIPLPSGQWADDHEATVLVAGASSGIGRAYAEWLAARHPRLRVIGCGRRPVTDAVGFRYAIADVTALTDLTRLAADIPTPDHIVCFAGEAASGLFVTKTRSTFTERMASKVQGPANLAAAFPDCPDIVLMSSVAGYIGAMGQAEYSAANAYLSGLAESADPATTGRFRCLSLSGWSEVGMARDLSDEMFLKTGPKEGLPLLHGFVTSGQRCASMFRLRDGGQGYSPLFAAEPRRPAARRPAHPSPRPANRPASHSASRTATRGSGAAPAAPGTAPVTPAAAPPRETARIRAAILGAWESVLGPDDYNPDVTFFEYGGDSVSVVTLGDELARVFPDVFDVTTLFSCSTVNDQTRWVEQSQASADTACDQAIDIAAIQQLLHANGGSR